MTMQTILRNNQVLDFFSDSLYDTRAINFWLKRFNPLWSTHEMLGQIVAKKLVAQDMMAITLRCNRHMQFGLAGQHHPVLIEIDGRRYERSYSLTRVDAEHVQLHVKKIPGGIVSEWLHEHARIGKIIEFGQVYGEVNLPQFKSRQLILLAAGSGITPIYSLLYELDQTQQLQHYKIELFYWVKQNADFAFKEVLKKWQQQYPQLHVHFLCTQEAPHNPRLNTDYLQQLQDISNSSVFACGPSGFTQTAQSMFKAARQLQTEAFSLSMLENDLDQGLVNITLSKSNKTLSIPKGQPILVALEQAKLKPTHGCRMGICNKCACNKISGSTKNLNDQSENAEPNNLLRICVNSAQSDLILDI